ncbi:hypothetical protein BDN71DRAFT_1511696 [Pleurotus eryngii]|uniref:Uncharacterized protein n=1 Tax=Pleurotus eryngii TaxID=5323 RepID=A0A9P6D2G4_PLEER|nr:hypothetical protein BDN71DRAFT_1511696 [Pleurotus eryngii]
MRYRASKIEITGNEREDTIRLQFDYPYIFEQTIFEHPWLLDFQRRYISTYLLKSMLSEHDRGEILPHRTLTHNGSWNHWTQGDLSEDAGFIRQMELNERNENNTEGEEVGKEVEQRKEEKRQGKRRTLQEDESFDILSTCATFTLDMDHAPLPQTYMMHADPPLSPLEALYPCPLDMLLPVEKQQIGCHEGLDLITEVAATILQTKNSDFEPDMADLGSKTPLLQYSELEQDRLMTESDATTQERTSVHPHPIFPAILPPNALHPGRMFIELRTDQPDIWGFNDFESTVVRLQSTPLYATTIKVTECIDPLVNHPLWNEDHS